MSLNMSMSSVVLSVSTSWLVSETVDKVVQFFKTRLLLKRYRPGHQGADDVLPAAVAECEAALTQMAEEVVEQAEAGQALDAVEWTEKCVAFSEAWMEVCHWVSPRKFREFLTEVTGATWVQEDAVPAALEQPPIDLKWYKTPEGQEAVQPCRCPACKVECNSLAQYRAHAQGRMHKRQARRWARRNGGKTVEPVLVDGAADAPSPKHVMEQKALQRKRVAGASASTAGSTSGLSEAGSSATSPRPLTVSSGCVSRNASLCTAVSASAPQTPVSPRTPVSPLGKQGGRVAFEPYNLGAASVFGVSEYDMLNASLLTVSMNSAPSCAAGGACVAARGAGTCGGVALSGAAQDAMQRLHGVLAGGVRDGAAQIQALALASSVADVAGEQVVDALVGAAASAEDSSALGALAGALAEADAAFEGELVDALVRRAVPAGACEEEAEARERRSLRGLVRLAAALVGQDALPVAVLLRCVGAALENAGAEDVAAAFDAVTSDAVAERFDVAAALEVQAQFAGALASKRFPSYVCAMVAPLVEA